MKHSRFKLLFLMFLWSCIVYSNENLLSKSQIDTAIISGTISNGQGQVSILKRLGFSGFYLIETRINLEHNSFKIKLLIERLYQVEFFLTERNHHPIINIQTSFVIEPGDSVFCIVENHRWKQTARFKGKGAHKYNFWIYYNNEFEKSLNAEATSLSAIEDAFIEIENTEKRMYKLLDESKDSLSGRFYKFVTNDIRYRAINLKFDIISKYYNNNPNEKSAKIAKQHIAFLDTMNIVNDEAVMSDSYMKFIEKYLQYKFYSLKKSSDLSFLGLGSKFLPQDIDLYYFSKVLLTGETQFLVLAKILNTITTFYKDTLLGNHIYQDFTSAYPDMEITKKINREYYKYKRLYKGEVAPNFTLKDVNNRNVSLSDFKGKVVYLCFWNSKNKCEILDILTLFKIDSSLKSNEFVFIYIDTNQNQEEWKKIIRENNLTGIHLNDPVWSSPESEIYNSRFRGKYYLINKKGKISKYNAPRPNS